MFDKPDINKLINRGMTTSKNIGQDEQMMVYGKVVDSKEVPGGSMVKTREFDAKGVAGVGF